MKVRVDAYIGERQGFDTAFLERRQTWLPYTGVYLEFILKGVYHQRVDFAVTSSDESAIMVSRHSWNRFFLNIQRSGDVSFKLTQNEDVIIEKTLHFSVVDIDIPLLFSIPTLFQYSISDIRFFANRLAENLVNGTRFDLFTTRFMENLANTAFQFEGSSLWRLLELVLSILTERGIVVFITPFNRGTGYSIDFVKKLRDSLFWLMERAMKFRIVWDLCEGLRRKELEATVDAILGRFKQDVHLAVASSCFQRIGGEGFSYNFREFKETSEISPNEKGVKIAQYRGRPDYFAVRKFSEKAARLNWGTEYTFRPFGNHLRKVQYSLSRALSHGYEDSKRK